MTINDLNSVLMMIDDLPDPCTYESKKSIKSSLVRSFFLNPYWRLICWTLQVVQYHFMDCCPYLHYAVFVLWELLQRSDRTCLFKNIIVPVSEFTSITFTIFLYPPLKGLIFFWLKVEERIRSRFEIVDWISVLWLWKGGDLFVVGVFLSGVI